MKPFKPMLAPNEEVKVEDLPFPQHGISINDQYRIAFYFKDGNAYDVEITDYH